MAEVQSFVICVGGITCVGSLLASVFIAGQNEPTVPESETDYYNAKPEPRRKLIYTKASPSGCGMPWSGVVSTATVSGKPPSIHLLSTRHNCRNLKDLRVACGPSSDWRLTHVIRSLLPVVWSPATSSVVQSNRLVV